jgi:DNA polymerase III subunit epsilon
VKRLWRWLWQEQHPVIRKNRQAFAGFDRDRPIESYEYVSMDTELTGLNPRIDEIVSIGAFRIRDMRIVVGENFFSYVRPTGPLPKGSTLIHRITPEQIKTAPDLATVLPQFVEFCGTSLLVGHFISLDLAFLNRASRKLLGGTIKNPFVDSMRLARAYNEQMGQPYYDGYNPGAPYNLTRLSQKFKLPLFAKHDALEDALQTAYLFLFLVKRLQMMGCKTLYDLLISGQTFPF